jgi:Bacterial SH3 domain
VILLLAALLAAADTPGAQLFADANAAYLSGDVSRAIAAYEALVSEGVASTELETNLGAAYLRQGKRGLAVLHFERALFLEPGDDDARADLVEVRRGNVDRLEGDAEEGGAETVARLLTPLPGTAAAAILALLWPAAWVLLGLRILRGSPRWAAVAAAGCFGGALLSALLTWGAVAGRGMAMRRGVVVAAAVPAREGPADKSVSRFEVHEGTAVRVDDEEAGFRRIKLANGLTGWVPADSVEPVVPAAWASSPVLTGPARAVQP